MGNKGVFISIEGIEGAGKSTTKKFIEEYLINHGVDVVMTREPGGTPIAEEVRNVLLAHYEETMQAETEMLLMFACRVQHVHEKIIPALNKGQWVVSDRFIDASYAYQGGGRKLGVEKIEALKEWLLGDFNPDLTFLLDVPLDVAEKRMERRKTLDRIEVEGKDFFETVRNTYLDLAHKHKDRFCVIDSGRSLQQVQQDIAQTLEGLIKSHAK